MATFLSTGDFAIVEFVPPNAAIWGVLSPIPGVPDAFSAAGIYTGALIPVYVVNSSSGAVSTIGGQAWFYDDSMLVVASTVMLTSHTLTAAPPDSLALEFAKDSSGNLYFSDSTSGTLRKFDAAAVAAFKAFLP